MILSRQLNIKTIGLCNAACSFCGYNKNAMAEKLRSGHKPSKLDAARFLKQLPLLKRKGIGILHFTGGEPFMHPEFIEIIGEAKRQGFQIRTGTNGSFLDEGSVERIRATGLDFLWYSLDTFPFAKHLEHRGFLDKREKMEKGLRLLCGSGINFFGQTVISRVIPERDGLPDLEAHMDYYAEEFGIHRFVFSYPMHRPETDDAALHLATIGSSAVRYSPSELETIFHRVIELKRRRKDLVIVNPYLSLKQQMEETRTGMSGMGCYAGSDIFFLGEDQDTLRPCYRFSGTIVDRLDTNPLKSDDSYLSCTECRDQCFRDPSIAYAISRRPLRTIASLLKNPSNLHYSLLDAWNLVKHKAYRDTRPPKR